MFFLNRSGSHIFQRSCLYMSDEQDEDIVKEEDMEGTDNRKVHADKGGVQKSQKKKRQAKQLNKDPITYQNKDVGSKVLAEHLPGKDFSVFGLRLPKIKALKPTNLPAVEANELQMDNLFLLEDDSYLLVDYESVYREKNKVKYLGYLARLSKRLYNESGRYPAIRVLIIYTADVKRGTTRPRLDITSLQMDLLEVFLSEMDGESILNEINRKLENGDTLSNDDLLRLMICPLTFTGRKAKVEATHRAILTADKITDEQTERFVFQMMQVVTNKFISEADAKKIREGIGMTKIDRILEEEKRQAIAKVEEEKEKALAEKEAEKKKALAEKEQCARRMLGLGVPDETVALGMGYTIEQVRALASVKA